MITIHLQIHYFSVPNQIHLLWIALKSILINLQDIYVKKKGKSRQVTRQVKRRNSLGDLSSTTSKKTSGLRKTIADKVVEALTSPEVLGHIIPAISDKLCLSIGNSLSKTVEAQVKYALDEHTKPLKGSYTKTTRKQLQNKNQL